MADFLQITCLYDMDIVFQPNGNFDEVYLYVGDYDPQGNSTAKDQTGGTDGSGLACHCKLERVLARDGSNSLHLA